MLAFVEVRLDGPTKPSVETFEAAVNGRPEVTECWRSSGDIDYLLRVSVADLDAYERLLTDGVEAGEGVSVARSHLAFRNVKASLSALALTPGDVRGVIDDPTSDSVSRPKRNGKRAVERHPPDDIFFPPNLIPPATNLDHIDYRILGVLSANARIRNVDLAERIGLSPATCWRRVRTLEKQRVILKYHTVVDYPTFNLFVVFIKLRLDRRTRESQRELEDAIQEVPEIVEVCRTDGESDYFLRGIVRGLDGLEQLLSENFLPRPGLRTAE